MHGQDSRAASANMAENFRKFGTQRPKVGISPKQHINNQVPYSYTNENSFVANNSNIYSENSIMIHNADFPDVLNKEISSNRNRKYRVKVNLPTSKMPKDFFQQIQSESRQNSNRKQAPDLQLNLEKIKIGEKSQEETPKFTANKTALINARYLNNNSKFQPYNDNTHQSNFLQNFQLNDSQPKLSERSIVGQNQEEVIMQNMLNIKKGSMSQRDNSARNNLYQDILNFEKRKQSMQEKGSQGIISSQLQKREDKEELIDRIKKNIIQQNGIESNQTNIIIQQQNLFQNNYFQQDQSSFRNRLQNSLNLINKKSQVYQQHNDFYKIVPRFQNQRIYSHQNSNNHNSSVQNYSMQQQQIDSSEMLLNMNPSIYQKNELINLNLQQGSNNLQIKNFLNSQMSIQQTNQDIQDNISNNYDKQSQKNVNTNYAYDQSKAKKEKSNQNVNTSFREKNNKTSLGSINQQKRQNFFAKKRQSNYSVIKNYQNYQLSAQDLDQNEKESFQKQKFPPLKTQIDDNENIQIKSKPSSQFIHHKKSQSSQCYYDEKNFSFNTKFYPQQKIQDKDIKNLVYQNSSLDYFNNEFLIK